MKTKIRIALPVLLSACLFGCSDEQDAVVAGDGSVRTITLRSATFASQPGGVQDVTSAEVESLEAFVFTDGTLRRRLTDIPVSQGQCRIELPETSGRLYLLANGGQLLPQDGTVEDLVMREDDFAALYASPVAAGVLQPFLTGVSDLAAIGRQAEVTMKRGVARVDLRLRADGIQVDSVALRGVAVSGRIFPDDVVNARDDVERTDWSKRYAVPKETSDTALCYLFEQAGEELQARVYARINGRKTVQTANFPAEIRRNTVYAISISGNGGQLVTTVEAQENWEEGGTVNGEWAGTVVIDRERTVLSKGARISAAGDTLYVPYTSSRIELVVSADETAEYAVSGHAAGVSLSEWAGTYRADLRGNRFLLTTELRHPGVGREYLYLELHDKDDPDIRLGRIVIALEPNATEFRGFGAWDDDYTCDYGTYVDGMLGTVKPLPEKKVALEFDEGEDEWARLVADEDDTGRYSFQAGWKPNDPKADGRKQKVRIVVSDADGGQREVYTVVRRNWGLPVVNVNGTWWCKYNLRGNVKSFADQILLADDPAPDGNVGDYLSQCSDEELLWVLGDQYQGGNPDGLQLTVTDGKFHYAGFSTRAESFGQRPATAMAPDGYQIPSYDDYRFFTASNDFNLGYGTGTFNNNLGQRLSFNIVERSVSFLGADYGPLSCYDFEYDGARLVLAGLGHQWNADNGSVAPMMVLFATHVDGINTWMIEGYSREDGRGNWYKYAAHNALKTRTVRCIKTPVEYIYE